MYYVYVLVSDVEDFYWEECYLSICSLLMHNEGASVIVLTDDLTKKTLESGYRRKIYEIADVREVIFDSNIGKMQRSRLLKVGIREYISGKILYLDTDTMICSDLSEVKNIECDIAMVLDHHEIISKNIAKRFYSLNEKLTGFPAGYEDKHFNSGVMYINDTQEVHDFFNKWKALYARGLSKGVRTDQASLNGLNCFCGGVIKELDGIWNVQLDYGLEYFNNAKIIHYFNHRLKDGPTKYNEGVPYELYETRLIKNFKKTGVLNPELKKLIENPKRGIKNARTVPIECDSYILMGSYQYKIMKVIFRKFRTLFFFNEKIIETFFVAFKKIRSS
nr:glycosyltransferase [uncultured Butyrivibrio sp.]